MDVLRVMKVLRTLTYAGSLVYLVGCVVLLTQGSLMENWTVLLPVIIVTVALGAVEQVLYHRHFRSGAPPRT